MWSRQTIDVVTLAFRSGGMWRDRLWVQIIIHAPILYGHDKWQVNADAKTRALFKLYFFQTNKL